VPSGLQQIIEQRNSPEIVTKMSGILEEEENEDDSLKSSSEQSHRKISAVEQSASGTSYLNIDITQSNMQDWNSVLDAS
jgi:hypothetical protein